jgi:hypothetical protein
MDLYLDIENIKSLINNTEHSLYHDTIKAIKKQFNIWFNFTKEEILQDDTLMAWFNLFTYGLGAENTVEFKEEKFPPRPLKSNCHIGFSPIQLSSIYLINDDKIELVKEKGVILIGSPGDEFKVFDQVFLLNQDYKFEKKLKIGANDFKHWNDLKPFTTCVSDIVFADPYILSDKNEIDVNLIPFLKVLVGKSRSKINLVLYVTHDPQHCSYSDISSKIRSAIEGITGVKPNFTLIKVRDQRGIASKAEHDRTVFTNYLRIYSGDTFNYFKSDGTKQTKGREIHFSSFGDNENHKISLEFVNDIQKKLDELPADAAEGDKKSNFLIFK